MVAAAAVAVAVAVASVAPVVVVVVVLVLIVVVEISSGGGSFPPGGCERVQKNRRYIRVNLDFKVTGLLWMPSTYCVRS